MPLLNEQVRHLVLYGSASSGKSYFAAQKVVFRTISEKGHRILCLRKVGSTVKDSIYQQLIDVVYDNHLQKEFFIHKTDKTLYHIPTGNMIYTKGLDEPEKIKSISGITSMWIEETTEFDEYDIDQLNLRIRGEKEHYIQYIYTFNPIDSDHWIKQRLVDSADKDPDIKYYKVTYKANSFLTEEDVNQLEKFKETNPLYYQIYCLGDWGVVSKDGKFLYQFDSQAHVDSVGYDPELKLCFSLDFNIDPFSCIIYQADENHLRVIEEIRLPDADIYQMTDRIRAKYPPDKYFLQATGDRTGYNKSGNVRGKTSYWAIVKEELNLSDHQLRLRSSNLDLIESRVLCNSALFNKDIVIDESCKVLIRDCQYATVDNKGVLLKDRVKNKNDFLDCFRYALDAEYPELTRKPKKRM